MIKTLIKKWFENNRPDYIFNGRLTNEFIDLVYEQIKDDVINSSNDAEELFIISTELDLSFDMELSKELYKKCIDIFVKYFEEEYEKLKEQQKLRDFLSEITFQLEKQGAIRETITYSENNEIELDEEVLDNLIYQKIKEIL